MIQKEGACLMKTILLASQSPRRRELVQLLGLPVLVWPANVDEDAVFHVDPAHMVIDIARLKAEAIVHQRGDLPGNSVVVAADTIVVLNGRLLGKPANESEAWHMLQALRGCTHQVHTGMVIIDAETGQTVSGVNTSLVTMRPYTDEEIAAYIATGDPMDKAGAYAIQHPTFRPVAALEGCFTGVMGLSVCQLVVLLNELGVVTNADFSAVVQAHQNYPCPLLTHLTS
ncbi:MAG: septum formation protein Maf [Chloroflexi bacterium]|nr:MAG: septum formation protein Maf [Chloroflexota bacterium]